MTNYPNISLKAARVNASLTQKEAARLLHISQSTLQSYESGETVPSYLMVKKIEGIYKFPSDYIFFGANTA